MPKITCPHCKSNLNVAEKYAGRSAKCPACQKPFLVEFQEPVALDLEAVISDEPPPAAAPATDRPRVIDGPPLDFLHYPKLIHQQKPLVADSRSAKRDAAATFPLAALIHVTSRHVLVCTLAGVAVLLLSAFVLVGTASPRFETVEQLVDWLNSHGFEAHDTGLSVDNAGPLPERIVRCKGYEAAMKHAAEMSEKNPIAGMFAAVRAATGKRPCELRLSGTPTQRISMPDSRSTTKAGNVTESTARLTEASRLLAMQLA